MVFNKFISLNIFNSRSNCRILTTAFVQKKNILWEGTSRDYASIIKTEKLEATGNYLLIINILTKKKTPI